MQSAKGISGHDYGYDALFTSWGGKEFYALCSCGFRSPVGQDSQELAHRDWENHVKCSADYVDEMIEIREQFEKIRQQYSNGM